MKNPNPKYVLLLLVFLNLGTKLIAQDSNEYELVSVRFQGNNSISTDLLETVISSAESPGWFWQFVNSFTSFGESAIYFDSLLIPNDLQSLKSLYESKGYFENEIRAEYFLNEEEKEAELIYLIKEGHPAVFREVNFYGFDFLPDYQQTDIFSRINIDTTEIFTNEEVIRNINDILVYLRDRGYVFAESESPIVYVDTLNNRADVEINFSTGKSYNISEVRVNKTGDGKDNVEDELISEIVAIDSGDVYSYIKMRRGQIRLYRTNLFTSALVTAVTSDTVGSTIPIGINTDIGRIHELSPEILLNDEDNTFNFGFALGFTKKNFLGSARKISLNLSTAAQNINDFVSNPSINDTSLFGYADARIIMEQPFVFGLPIETKLETYYTLQKRKAEFNAILYGGKLSFNFELPPYTYFNTFNTFFNLENSRYKFHESYIRNIMNSTLIDTSQMDINIPDVSENTSAVLGVVLGANKTNDFLFPSEGYNFSLTLEDGNALGYGLSKLFGITFNNPLYYRAIVSYSYYIPLTQNRKTVLAAKIKSGYIKTYRGNQYDIPLNQRFYVGGSNSVRGWNTRELVPQKSGIVLPENPTSDEIEAILLRGIIPGGFFMIEGSVEARTRLIGPLGSAFFIDYGNSWNSYHDVVPNGIAVAIGFGLRYYSDIVPIRIDFGLKLYDPSDRRSMFNKHFFEEIFQFHLGIGEAY